MLLLLAACGGLDTGPAAVDPVADDSAATVEPTSISLNDAIECRPDGPLEGSSTMDLFSAPGWLDFSNDALRKAIAASEPTESGGFALPTENSTVLIGDSAPQVVYVHRLAADGVRIAADYGASLLFPFSPAWTSEEGLSTLIAYTDEEITFAEGCLGDGLGPLLFEFSSNTMAELSAAEVARQLVLPDTAARIALESFLVRPQPDPPQWEDLSARDRLLDRGVAPEAVLDRLPSIAMILEIPETWAALDGSICFFLPTQGWWWGCVPTSLDGGPTVVQVEPFVLPGQGLEIWLTDGLVSEASQITLLGVVPASQVSQAVHDDMSIRATFTASPPMLGDVEAGKWIATTVITTGEASDLLPSAETPGQSIDGP